MTLQSDYAGGINAIYDLAAVPAVFTDRDGKTTNVNAIVEYDLSQYGNDAQIAVGTAVISVRVSELPEVPRSGDRYTIDGKYLPFPRPGTRVYLVSSPIVSNDLEHAVLVA